MPKLRQKLSLKIPNPSSKRSSSLSSIGMTPEPSIKPWKLQRRHDNFSVPTSSGLLRLTEKNLAMNEARRIRKRSRGLSLTPDSCLSESNESVSHGTVTTTDSKFGRRARHNGILDHDPSMPPINLKDIQLFLGTERDSPDPSQTEFTSYDKDVRCAPNEATIMLAVVSDVLKKSRDPLYKSYAGSQFADFPTDVGFNNGLSAARPHWVEGYLEDAFGENSIIGQLDGAAVRSQGNFPIVLAHLAGEFKKRGGNMICGSDQAAYDAAYLVYGTTHARTLKHQIDEAGMAYVGSFVCDGSRLQISVHYATKHPATGAMEFRQYLMFDENIQRDYAHFIQGRKWLRNLQDWSRCNANMIREPSNDDKQGPRKSLHRGCKGKAIYNTKKRKGGNVGEAGHS